jgi:hypothetical protein
MLLTLAGGGTVAAFGGNQIAASACGGGSLVVNVTYKVVNDADSGFYGTPWAFDAYNRQVQIWQTGPNAFCATVNYDGQFVTVPGGGSPGSGVILTSAVKGTFNGGYRTSQFTGTLVANPSWPTRGNLGTVDYGCNTDPSCPGIVIWKDVFFTNVAGDSLVWWGWEYKYKNQRWVNSSDGSTGDITG